MTFFNNLVSIFLEAAPWLLLGFIAAGLIKVWIPKDGLQRWLGGKGLWTVTKAAIIGAPLPLCSCGVLPAATELHRNGASRSSTVSFLISTPETGVDSIALSYVLLGPVMAIIRPIAAVGSAIITGLITALVPDDKVPENKVPDNKIENNEVTCVDSHCGCSTATQEIVKQESSCCSSSACNKQQTPGNSFITRTWSGLKYALVDMVDDLILWLSIGLILAAIISTVFPPMAMAEWGSGLSAMLLMLLIGVPMYICATASTPIAASLILAGVSPGTVLVFLLAGPATNIATIGVIQKEMGKGVVIAYLSGISICSIMFGYLTDWYINYNDFNVMSQMTEASEWMPEWIAQFSAIILLIASANILLNKARGILRSTIRQEE